MVCLQSASEDGMGPTKTPITPAVISILLIIMVEFFARRLLLSPLLVTGFARVIEIVVITGVFYLTAGGVSALGMSTDKIRHGIIRGVLWSLGFGLIAGVLAFVLIVLGLNPLKFIDMSLPDTMNQMIIFYMVGGFIGPVAEELFFRGIIYGYLRNRFATQNLTFGITMALTVSTLLFVVAHSGGSGIPLPQLVGGIVFCLSYEKEKSLLTPMIIHCTGNMAMFTISLLSY